MPSDPPTTIRSPRLDLVLLEVDYLRRLHVGQPPPPATFTDPDQFLGTDPDLLRRRLAQEEGDPSVHGWLLRAVVLRTSNQVVGRVNFHDRPDSDGLVEIGYAVHPAYRRQGYGRELAIAMWSWAATRQDVATLRASIAPHNAASLAIAATEGFIQVGSQLDPEDGLELVYELSAAAFRDGH